MLRLCWRQAQASADRDALAPAALPCCPPSVVRTLKRCGAFPPYLRTPRSPVAPYPSLPSLSTRNTSPRFSATISTRDLLFNNAECPPTDAVAGVVGK